MCVKLETLGRSDCLAFWNISSRRESNELRVALPGVDAVVQLQSNQGQMERAMSTTKQEVVENNRTLWTIYIVVGIISLLLIGGVFYIARKPVATGAEQTKLEGALRAGSPDFDKYIARITVDKPDAMVGVRTIGDIVMTLTTTVRNFTGKTIDGLEMRGAVVDLEGNTVKERTVIVVPNTATGIQELEPNKTLAVPILLEGMSKEADRANIKMEVTAIRFK